MSKYCKICKIGMRSEGDCLCFDCNNNIEFIMGVVFSFILLCLLLIYLGGFIFFDIILLLIGIVIICGVVIITLYTLAYILLYFGISLKELKMVKNNIKKKK